MGIKALNSFKKKQTEIPAPPPPFCKQEILLSEIRDLLKDKTFSYIKKLWQI